MKTICITPVNKNIKYHVEALNIKNEFIKMGFTTVSGFVGVVQENLEDFKDYKDCKRLLSFWSGRMKNEDLNIQLAGLLEKLKAE